MKWLISPFRKAEPEPIKAPIPDLWQEAKSNPDKAAHMLKSMMRPQAVAAHCELTMRLIQEVERLKKKMRRPENR